MNKLNFNLNVTIHCKNGKCGKLQKLIVDPNSMAITNLIVGRGILQTKDRIVPVLDVDRATEDYVILSVTDIELDDYPEYVEYAAPDASFIGTRSEQKLAGLTFDTAVHRTGPTAQDTPIPYRQTVHANVHPDHKTIERGTPVHNHQQKIGHIDHVLADAETNELTHLVINRGLLNSPVAVPVSEVQNLDDSGIWVHLDKQELDRYPGYAPRQDDEIVTELREQLETVALLDDIRIHVENGILTLTGSIPNITAKKQLEYVARTLKGVLDVENQLQPDYHGTAPILTALMKDPRTESAVIEVIGTRGIVTLKGVVNAHETIEAAIEIAAAQPGVSKVLNGLSVNGDHFTPDFVAPFTNTQLTT